MGTNNKNERSPKDLSVPETMTIAALLAELMPPGSPLAKPATLPTTSGDSIDDTAGDNLTTPSLAIEELDDVEPVLTAVPPPIPVESQPTVPVPPSPVSAMVINPAAAPHRPPPVPRITATVVTGPSAAAKPPAPPRPRLEPAREVVEVPPAPLPPPVPPPLPKPAAAAPNSEPAGELIGNLRNKRDFKLPVKSVPLDPELIPIGNLSASGYFSLVNWRNDPERARHPRRADFGLDELTVAQAQRNPFYVLGQPRRPELASVAEVLAEIKW